MMRTFQATIKERSGSTLKPTYTANDDFWKWHEPYSFLVRFWGLDKPDVESYEIREIT